MWYANYMRLNKFLARASGISRREADDVIASGQVTVNGQAANIGQSIDEQHDAVIYKGQKLTLPTADTTIMLNKPVGYVCSRKRQGDSPTVYELLPKDFQKLKTIGRLDKDSSGLILLSDNGDLAHQLTHPKFAKVKEYTVTLDHPLSALHQQMISDFGISLEDGTSQLILESLNDKRTKFRVTMHEGRNRQIRRTFAALGYQVKTLHRLSFDNYQLGNLEPGQWKSV